MRKSILVKPNLKLIVLGALAIVVLHDVFTRGMSEPSVFLNHEYSVAWMTDSELARLIERVDVSPNSAGYLLISEAYERRGDMRKALYYVRKADAIAPQQDFEE